MYHPTSLVMAAEKSGQRTPDASEADAAEDCAPAQPLESAPTQLFAQILAHMNGMVPVAPAGDVAGAAPADPRSAERERIAAEKSAKRARQIEAKSTQIYQISSSRQIKAKSTQIYQI